jgi:DNA-binding XRE family transcriptional regulator
MARPSQIDPRERKLILLLKVGISRTTITNLELDDARPTLWVLLKLADGLGLGLDTLLKKASR